MSASATQGDHNKQAAERAENAVFVPGDLDL